MADPAPETPPPSEPTGQEPSRQELTPPAAKLMIPATIAAILAVLIWIVLSREDVNPAGEVEQPTEQRSEINEDLSGDFDESDGLDLNEGEPLDGGTADDEDTPAENLREGESPTGD